MFGGWSDRCVETSIWRLVWYVDNVGRDRWRLGWCESGNDYFDFVRPGGADAAKAEAQGRARTPAEQAEIIKNAPNISGENSKAATALDLMTKAVKSVEAILANVFVGTMVGAVAGMIALAAAAYKAALALNMVGGKGMLADLGVYYYVASSWYW